MSYERITKIELDETTGFFRQNFPLVNHVDLVIQLGSGQHAHGLLDEEYGRKNILDLPNIPDEPSIARSDMDIIWGSIGDKRVLVFCGRFHMYEGHGRLPVILPIWAAAECGARTFLLCNAASGIDEMLQPGKFMLMKDHINNLGVSALAGHQHMLRNAFVDMTEVYDPRLGGTFFQSAQQESVPIHKGIYWANRGPQFETPAETQLAHAAGASAVGMSTALEATIAHTLGAKIVGVSMITNRASGLAKNFLSHEETLARGTSLGRDLVRVIRRWVTHEAKELL